MISCWCFEILSEPENISGYSRAAQKADRRYSRHERENRLLVKRSEDFQVIDDVFDMPTLLVIKDMINHGILSSMKSHLASGKESKVYLATSGTGEPVAVKIFLTVSAEFKKRIQYIEGDPRFEGVKRGSTRNLISVWAKKEFHNLQQAAKSGASVPAPISVRRNVLVMEFIDGGDGNPAAILGNSESITKQDYLAILDQIKTLYQRAGLVHADLSEYNVMKTDSGRLVLFDFGSAVSIKHPNSKKFLERDLANISRFFSQRGIETIDLAHLLRMVLGESPN